MFEHQQPLLRRNLEEEQQYANEHRLAAEGMRSLCVLPLIFQGKCIGTLSFVSQERDRYSNEDAAFLQDVSNQVALAVTNMRSYEEITALNTRVERTAERYRTLLEINNAIITNLTQESLLNAICDAVQRVVPLYRAALTLYDPDTDSIRILALSTPWNSNYFRVGAR